VQRRIKIYGDSILKQVAEPVTQFDEELDRLIEDMKETMDRAPGIGLAAPQIGVSKRVIIVTFGLDEGHPEVRELINPNIVAHSREREVCEEGCLSVPDYTADVERWSQIEVEAFLRDGTPIFLKEKGTTARIIQHETDHLNGVLFVDRLSPIKKEFAHRKLRRRLRKEPLSA